MDVNGTRFHLIKGQAEWTHCWWEEVPSGEAPVAYDEESAALILKPELALFPRGERDRPLPPERRRGAAVDGYGNWYWIANDGRRLYWRPAGSSRSTLYYEPAPAAPAAEAGAFHPHEPRSGAEVILSGLAVTEDHYLVAGDAGDESGLIIIDLHAGAPPWRLRLPTDAPFVPWDIAPAPGGGVWILDRENAGYWGLDRYFRVVVQPAAAAGAGAPAGAFRPTDGSTLPVPAAPAATSAFPLAEVSAPLSIEALPDLSVLILDNPAGSPHSILHHYAYDEYLGNYPLQDEVDVTTLGDGSQLEALEMVGHDMAHDAAAGVLYVMERDGNQAVAWTLQIEEDHLQLKARLDYLPMPYGGGRALVAGVDGAYYDVGGSDPANDGLVRWLRVRAIDRARYSPEATIVVGQPPAAAEVEAGAPVFDGKERGCVWHRLLLDGCIPPETRVQVWSRAHDERTLLENLPFRREPDLYLRGNGAEISFYDPYPEKKKLPPGTGTWELLLQQAQGRYLQLRLRLAGNGRVTPRLRALRLYYPRFSYPANYLPAVYADEETPGPFLERMLANMEGFFTEVEGQIQHASALFDPRTAPPEALDWLAGWVGLMLDPMWAQLQEKRAERDDVDKVPPGSTRVPDRRRLFIRFARLLYERRGTPDGILFALQLLLEPCLEQLLAGLQRAAVERTHPLREVLAFYGLAPPTPTTSATEFEELLFEFLLRRPSQVRLVERFLIRRGQGGVSGLPEISAPDATEAPLGSSVAAFRANAHRFTVLVPVTVAPEEEAMVRRIVWLEKPAHTDFSLRRYWEGFRAGEARLGIDTTLDQSNRFVALLLGRDYLAEGYLPAAHPQNVPERIVADRGRYRDLPRL